MSGWSSSATASWGWRSHITCTAAFQTRPRASWPGCGRTWCRGRAARSWRTSSGWPPTWRRGAWRSARWIRRRSSNRRPSARPWSRRRSAAATSSTGSSGCADAVVEAFSGRVDYALVEHVDYKTVAPGGARTSGPVGNVCRCRDLGPASPACVHVGRDGGWGRARPRLRLEQEGVGAARGPAGARGAPGVVAGKVRRRRGRCT